MKNPLFWLLFLGLVFIFLRWRSGTGTVPQAMLQEQLQKGALVLDVRTTAEFASGHYPGAVHIPVSDLADRLSELGDKNRAVVVYCRSGARAGQACSLLKKAGWLHVTNAGGLDNLPAAGGP